jgi:hypothetical protein
MSAAAHATDVRQVVPDLHLAEAAAKTTTVADVENKEMYRWMLWFGIPVIFMAIFMGATFVTNSLYGIFGVLGFLIADICILIWLCMSSDTNGVGGTEFASGH